MAEPSKSNNDDLSTLKKKIKVHKPESQCSKNSSASSSGGGIKTCEKPKDKAIPLIARDSKWVGIDFASSCLQQQSQEDLESYDEEIFIVNADDSKTELPLYTLFPNLREKLPPSTLKKDNIDTTTEITKSLLGEKPNPSLLKKSRKFISKQLNLPSVQEFAAEEPELTELERNIVEEPSDFAKSIHRCPLLTNSTTSKEFYEDDCSIDENKLKRKRKTKKKSAGRVEADIESSCSGLNVLPDKPVCKLNAVYKPPKKKIRRGINKILKTGNGSSADNESES